MKKNKIDLAAIKLKYEAGVNITQELRKEFNVEYNTPEIIEIAYDMQTGTYIEEINDKSILYFNECASILSKYINNNTVILDAGAGELTTTAGIVDFLKFEGKIFAFDISWSRLYVGKKYFSKKTDIDISVFIGDLMNIPLAQNSMDVIYTNHALEPNRGSEKIILEQLCKIAKEKIVLFEPYYEAGTPEIKERMDAHNYIRDLKGAIESAGGVLEEIIELKTSINPMNPTYAFIINPKLDKPEVLEENPFLCPATGFKLEKKETCYFSPESLLAYPIIEGIPVLKSDFAIIASKMAL